MIKRLRSQAKKSLNQLIKTYFTIRHYWLVWFFVLNRRGRRLFKSYPPKLNELEKKVSEDLTMNGIAVTHLNDLFPDQYALLTELQSYTNKLRGQAETKTVKTFLKYMFEETPTLDFTNPFLKLILQLKILNIVNTYLGVCGKFYYLTLNITTPLPAGTQPVASQRWHRDPEDKKLCKIFIYLTDVDQSAGPFIYVLGSQFGGRYQNLFPQKPPSGIYPPIGAVERLVPKDDIKYCTGRAGTVIFCDTSGLHKGGYATATERIMFTGGFQSDAGPRPLRYQYPDGFNDIYKTLNPIQQFALTINQKKISSYAWYLYNRLKRSFKYEYQVNKKTTAEESY